MAGYTKVEILGDIDLTYSVLETLVTNHIIGGISITKTSSLDTITMYIDADKTQEVFKIELVKDSGRSKYRYTATLDGGYTYSIENKWNDGSGDEVRRYIIQYGYACKNGVFFTVGGRYSSDDNVAPNSYCVIITKNQLGVPTLVMTNSATSSTNVEQVKTNMNTEYCIAASDIGPCGSYSRSAPKYALQTVISSFFSGCEVETVSYTPDAGRVLSGTYGSIIYSTELLTVQFDNSIWLTDGYLALRT